MSDDGETAPVTVTVLAIERVTLGKIVALAAVEIVIDGIAILLNGVQVFRSAPGVLSVGPPTFRSPTGASRSAVILPEELNAPLGDAVMDRYRALT